MRSEARIDDIIQQLNLLTHSEPGLHYASVIDLLIRLQPGIAFALLCLMLDQQYIPPNTPQEKGQWKKTA